MKDRKRSGLYQASTSLLLLFTSVSQIPFLLPKSGGSLPGNVQLAIIAWNAFAKGHFKASHSWFQRHGSQSLINPTKLSVRMGPRQQQRWMPSSKQRIWWWDVFTCIYHRFKEEISLDTSFPKVITCFPKHQVIKNLKPSSERKQPAPFTNNLLSMESNQPPTSTTLSVFFGKIGKINGKSISVHQFTSQREGFQASNLTLKRMWPLTE